MLDEFALGRQIFNRDRDETPLKRPETAVLYGTAVEDSQDGSVRVVMDGVTTSGDGTVTIPTAPAVKAGDTVVVTVTGGRSKAPFVSGVIGSGDRQQEEINRSLTAYTDDSTYYLLSATVPATPTDETWEAAGWSTDEPVVSQEDTRTLYVSRRVELVDGTVTWSAPAKVVTSASIEVAKNAILATVSETYATKDEALNTASGSGRSITTTDAAGLPLRDITVYGESVQDGTPTPDAPVPIQTVVRSDGTIGIGVTHDGTETVTPIDLQGNVLASLPDGTRDILHVENGRAWIEKNVGYTDMGTLSWQYNSNWNGRPAFYTYSLRSDIVDWQRPQNAAPIMCSVLEVKARNVVREGSDNGICLYGKDVSLRYAGISSASEFTAAVVGQYLLYLLATPQTIDLGEVSLPVVQDGDTVRVIAEVQPVFDTSWWRDTDIVGRTTDVQSEAATAAKNAQNTANTANEKADTLNESVTELSVRAGKITASVKSMQQDYGGTVQSVNSNMTFDANGLTIGRSDSTMKSHFTNSTLTFEANGQEVMKLDGESSTVSADRWQVGGWLFYKADGGKTLVLDYFG